MNNGPMWVDLRGTEVTPEEHAILRHPQVGGIVLFNKNFANKKQITNLVSAARAIAGKNLLVGVDNEGGRVWRFGEGFTHPESAQYFGEMYLREPDAALQRIQEAGQIIASELIACGIDLTFAPVLDLEHGVSTVIYERSYGRDPKVVIACARAFIAGLRKQGMGSVGKHFPGHGGCSMDSHFTSATDTRTFVEITNDDMQTFAALNNDLTAIMPAHVLYAKIDKDLPCFSKFWLQEVLRKQLGFTGAIISDCLSMHGSGQGSGATDLAAGVMSALDAGCDMVIMTQATKEYTNQPRIDILKVLDKVNWEVRVDQRERIHSLSANFAWRMLNNKKYFPLTP